MLFILRSYICLLWGFCFFVPFGNKKVGRFFSEKVTTNSQTVAFVIANVVKQSSDAQKIAVQIVDHSTRARNCQVS